MGNADRGTAQGLMSVDVRVGLYDVTLFSELLSYVVKTDFVAVAQLGIHVRLFCAVIID